MTVASTLTLPASTSSPSDRVRVGLVGFGYWGPNLARNFATCADTELAAIADMNAHRLEAARGSYPFVRMTTNVGDMLADPTIDAVAIATPPETHYPLAKAALESGKHVLVEKPLVTTIAHGEELLAIAHDRGLQLMVDHTFLFTGAVRKIREYIDRGELGELYYFDSVRINLGLFQHDTNVIWDLAPHDVAILLHLIDQPVVSVSALGARHVDMAVENIAYVTLRFGGPLLAHLHVNWLAPAKVRRTIIGGSRKMLVYDDMEPSEKLKVYDSGVHLAASTEEIYRSLVEYRTGDVLSPKLDKTEALANEVAHFARIIKGLEEPISDGTFGLRVVGVIRAAQESLARNGAPVEVCL